MPTKAPRQARNGEENSTVRDGALEPVAKGTFTSERSKPDCFEPVCGEE
jgi:hypothetical protein